MKLNKRESNWSTLRRVLHRFRCLLRELRDILQDTVFAKERIRFPPAWLRDVGPTDFKATGEEFLRHFVDVGLLRPSEKVLDVGCGSGRMAIPLSRYLDRDGRYTGIDIVAPAIRWCRRNISRSHPNFEFLHCDVWNSRYNPGGTISAGDYVFPFDDGSFDFIFLTSVFTHMYPAHTSHYLREMKRLLRQRGRLFSTFFLFNPAQQALAREGRNQIDFCYDLGDFWTRDRLLPESAIALGEEQARAMLVDAGFQVREPILYGSWSGRTDTRSFQDVVVVHPASEALVEAE